MRGTRITTVAVYERRIRASVERIFENALDWERLPGLHRDSFASVRRTDSGDWGWSAWVRGAPGAREMALQLVIDRAGRSYVIATIEGPGKGSEIHTSLVPKADDETQIRMEFRVPDVSPERAAALGEAYRTLYARMWDEDEAMMLRRARLQAVLRVPVPQGRLELGPVTELRSKLPQVVEWAGRPWRIVELDGALVVHAGICPHALGPLETTPLEGSVVECPWHRYRFDVRTGKSCDGRGLRLASAPRIEVAPDGRAQLVQAR
ncbi:MAG TPA: Rieske (2Fe-2S) protein [Myxococcota bacterium]|nr:Rieske (2Fe-2S) protein [Myxococcota bacterium]